MSIQQDVRYLTRPIFYLLFCITTSIHIYHPNLHRVITNPNPHFNSYYLMYHQEQRIAGRDGHDRRMYSFPEDGNNFEFLISSFATLTLMVYDDGGEHGYGSLQLDAEQEVRLC